MLSSGILDDGSAVAWGNNEDGQCDIPDTKGRAFVQVSAGYDNVASAKSSTPVPIEQKGQDFRTSADDLVTWGGAHLRRQVLSLRLASAPFRSRVKPTLKTAARIIDRFPLSTRPNTFLVWTIDLSENGLVDVDVASLPDFVHAVMKHAGDSRCVINLSKNRFSLATPDSQRALLELLSNAKVDIIDISLTPLASMQCRDALLQLWKEQPARLVWISEDQIASEQWHKVLANDDGIVNQSEVSETQQVHEQYYTSSGRLIKSSYKI
jgi:hypothetical protein